MDPLLRILPHMGNPGQNVGTLERQTANQLGGLDPPVQTPYRQSGGMGSFAGNPFWSPEARALFEGPMTDGPTRTAEVWKHPRGYNASNPSRWWPVGWFCN